MKSSSRLNAATPTTTRLNRMPRGLRTRGSAAAVEHSHDHEDDLDQQDRADGGDDAGLELLGDLDDPCRVGKSMRKGVPPVSATA